MARNLRRNEVEGFHAPARRSSKRLWLLPHDWIQPEQNKLKDRNRAGGLDCLVLRSRLDVGGLGEYISSAMLSHNYNSHIIQPIAIEHAYTRNNTSNNTRTGDDILCRDSRFGIDICRRDQVYQCESTGVYIRVYRFCMSSMSISRVPAPS